MPYSSHASQTDYVSRAHIFLENNNCHVVDFNKVSMSYRHGVFTLAYNDYIYAPVVTENGALQYDLILLSTEKEEPIRTVLEKTG